jgi:hypothetical protein
VRRGIGRKISEKRAIARRLPIYRAYFAGAASRCASQYGRDG